MLEAYGPTAADPADVDRIIDATIAEVDARSPGDHGRVMKALMPKLTSVTVDGREVHEAVRRKLSENAP